MLRKNDLQSPLPKISSKTIDANANPTPIQSNKKHNKSYQEDNPNKTNQLPKHCKNLFNYLTMNPSMKLEAIQDNVHQTHKRLKKYEKNQRFLIEVGDDGFNIEDLKKKVKALTKSGRLNANEITAKYRKDAIKNKKDSKLVEDYHRSKKNASMIYKQKVLVNLEFDKAIRDINNAHYADAQRNIDFMCRNLWHSDQGALIGSGYISPYKMSRSKSFIKPKTSVTQMLRAEIERKEAEILTNHNKVLLKKLADDQKTFLHRYGSCISLINKSKESHLLKGVFTSKEIDTIMKNRREILINSLMNAYVNNYNRHLELKKEINSKVKINMKNCQNAIQQDPMANVDQISISSSSNEDTHTEDE